MFATPAAVLGVWFRGLLSIGLIALGGWLIYQWFDGLPKTARVERPAVSSPEAPANDRPGGAGREAVVVEERPLSATERISAWKPGADWATATLVGGAALLVWSLAGSWLHPRRLWMRPGEPVPKLPPAEEMKIARPDGTELHVEIRGRADAPTVILTHGWGMSREEWAFLQRDWGDRFRTVVWDLPGLGKSKQPKNHDFSMEKLANDLAAVIEATSTGPVVVMGHSIGGMIALTLAKLRPDWFGTRIKKLALVHTSYMNPVHTMQWHSVLVPLQKPLIEPLLYLQIALSPVVWLMNALSYLNGSLQSQTIGSGFGGRESREKVDFVASYGLQDDPAVLARGSFGMLAYDARPVLASLTLPTLVVSAEQDPVTLPEANHLIQAEAPNGRLVRLEQAKHYGLLEHNAEFARKTAEFIASDL